MLINLMDVSRRLSLFMSAILFTQIALSAQSTPSNLSLFNPKRATYVLQLGGFNATQGESQDIDIDGLIGDHFTVTSSNDQNVLVGLGYFVDGFTTDWVTTIFGLNAFYLAQTFVKGNVLQEQAYNNLSYRYSVTNYPIYLAGRALFKTSNPKYSIAFDLGIGPNIIQTGNVDEYPLDDITIPDNSFSGDTSAAFSVTTGLGIRFNRAWNSAYMEIGYRFFYLGEGQFNKQSSQFLNDFTTGNNYANALVFTVSV